MEKENRREVHGVIEVTEDTFDQPFKEFYERFEHELDSLFEDLKKLKGEVRMWGVMQWTMRHEGESLMEAIRGEGP